MEPDNAQLLQSLDQVERNLRLHDGSGPGGAKGFANPFADPNLLAKIASNPKLQEYMRQPDYLKMLQEIMSDPNGKLPLYMQDPRLMQTMAALLGLDLSEAGMGEEPMEEGPDDDNYVGNKSQPPPPPKSEEPEKPVLTDNQQKALQAKELGNAAYKSKVNHCYYCRRFYLYNLWVYVLHRILKRH